MANVLVRFRHLYIPIIEMGYGKNTASVTVFFISAFFHEYLVSVPLKTFKIWAFMGMMGQVRAPRAYAVDRWSRKYWSRLGNAIVDPPRIVRIHGVSITFGIVREYQQHWSRRMELEFTWFVEQGSTEHPDCTRDISRVPLIRIERAFGLSYKSHVESRASGVVT